MQQGSERKKRVTITDVARHAGVSTAAVSKVMRNAYGVSAAMREKVRTAMAELDYRPHAAARGMRGRTYTIGILLDNIRNTFFADILDGIRDELRDSEYTVLIGDAGFGAEAQGKTVRAMVDRRMDGLVLVAPSTRRSEVLSTAQSTPTVVIGHHDTSELHDSVVDADGAGAGLVVDHLVSLGHRNIALVSSPGTRSSKWARTPEIVLGNGYAEAMGRHHLAEHTRICRTTYSDEGGYKAGLSLLTAQDRPTAIMTGADVAALGVWRAAHELGLRVPGDVSLVGYHNTAVADLATVRLTSVDQAGHDMGATAARLLIERVEGHREHAVLTTMTPRLVVRDSTSVPPGGWASRAPRPSGVRRGPGRGAWDAGRGAPAAKTVAETGSAHVRMERGRWGSPTGLRYRRSCFRVTENVWGYRSTASRPEGVDLTGYKVEATDGSIGKVDKHSDEVDDAYLVVDTGVWIFGKEVLLPASTVLTVDTQERRIIVDRTRQQIKDAPEFDRDKHLGDRGYREELGTYYGPGGPHV